MGYISFCDWCEKQMKRKEGTNIEMVFMHRKIKDDICNDCNKLARARVNELRGKKSIVKIIRSFL